jgi:AraC-like DNA-binding protein
MVEERAGVMSMSSKQIGCLLGLGEARLLRLFNSEVGKTLRSHLREVRMAQAAELLTDYILPIKTIACRCGYSEVSNFYRDFRMVHGTSPLQMRLSQMSHARSSHQSTYL